MAELLLHSLAEFDEIIFEVITRQAPSSILEIGSETGAFSKRLHEWCRRADAKLTSIEPNPDPEVIAQAVDSTRFDLVVGTSIPYLAEHGCSADLVLVDGDHNYFTVKNEIELIAQSWRERGIAGTIILHDVGFPNARRDSYYEPQRIPKEWLRAHSFELGVTLDRKELIHGGFRGAGHFAWANVEGGPRNGVLTAVEDFLQQHAEYRFDHIDAIFGLGALTLRDSAVAGIVAEVFGRYDNRLIHRLERNRIELYLKVLELQDALEAQRAGQP